MFLDGRDVTRAGPCRRATYVLARTFQRLEFFGRLSVRDNLLVAAEIGPQQRKASAVVDDIIDLLGLAAVAATTADSLSTGMDDSSRWRGRWLAARQDILYDKR